MSLRESREWLSSANMEKAGPQPRVPGWKKRDEEREREKVARAALSQQVVAHLGGIFSALTAPPEGDVLGTRTAVLPASGVWSENFKIPAQAVAIANPNPFTLTLVLQSPSGEIAPTQGAGVFTIPGGSWRLVSGRATAVSVYGPAIPAGSPPLAFDITAYARPRDPAAASIGINPYMLVIAPPGSTASSVVVLNEVSPGASVVAWLTWEGGAASPNGLIRPTAPDGTFEQYAFSAPGNSGFAASTPVPAVLPTMYFTVSPNSSGSVFSAFAVIS